MLAIEEHRFKVIGIVLEHASCPVGRVCSSQCLWFVRIRISWWNEVCVFDSSSLDPSCMAVELPRFHFVVAIQCTGAGWSELHGLIRLVVVNFLEN